MGRAADPHMVTSQLLGTTSPVLRNTGIMMPLFENNPINMNSTSNAYLLQAL